MEWNGRNHRKLKDKQIGKVKNKTEGQLIENSEEDW
jgi:hypothetical protein